MCKNDNLDLQKAEQRKNELEMVLNWRIIPQLHISNKYRVTIAYSANLSSSQNIKILGSYKGSEIPSKILAFFDKFLTDVNSFGLLLESLSSSEVSNWDISFSNFK